MGAVARRSAAAVRQVAPSMELETWDTWWGDKDYPDSVVLGIGKNVPSKVFGVTSGLALFIGLYCVAQSNLLNILRGHGQRLLRGGRAPGPLLVGPARRVLDPEAEWQVSAALAAS